MLSDDFPNVFIFHVFKVRLNNFQVLAHKISDIKEESVERWMNSANYKCGVGKVDENCFKLRRWVGVEKESEKEKGKWPWRNEISLLITFPGTEKP